MPNASIRVLVVDDELLARQRILDLLAHESGVEVIGTAEGGAAAVEAIKQNRPDLVFLDVQMPGMTGLDVVRTIGPDAMPATIFVTAFDQYALRAFEVAALDYLVKPFDDERFEQAFRRARRLIELSEIGKVRAQLLAVLAQTGEGDRATTPRVDLKEQFLERIAVEMKGKMRVVPVDQIDYITSDGPYAELHTGDRTHIIREPMHVLETRLDPRQFIRIHRSAIVKLALIDTLHRGAGGDYEVQLKSGLRLPVSRSRREELERRLGVITRE
jgi:two-component system, LytTR family, response regulator